MGETITNINVYIYNILLGDTMKEDDIMYKSGEYIFKIILKKINELKLMAYEPSCIILWEDYYKGLYDYATKMGLYCFGDNHLKRIFGLDVLTTQIPDIIEVY